MSIRVLIVDDSVFYQHRLQEMLDADPGITVVGVASNGQQAIELTKSLKPDVITMDVEMPVMDGISAVRCIMNDCPTPVLMISALTKRGAHATFEAMDAGALDFLPKDFHDIVENRNNAAIEICNKVISVANKKIRRRNGSLVAKPSVVKALNINLSDYEVLAIGASTGGPVALQKILKKLPRNFPLPIIIIQHMPPLFTPMFAERLDQMCAINVKQASDGDVLFPGCAYVAPGGKQTIFKKKGQEVVIEISEGDPTLSYRPSVDVTLTALADKYPSKVLAIILTGMGADGREGARKLKQTGADVWAQDEASSVVYGMPMAVAKAGLADEVMSLEHIATTLSKDV